MPCAASTGRTPTPRIGLDAPARRRLAFDELLANQLALGLLRRRSDGGGRALQATGRLRQGVLAALPFRLTPAQERALAEIDADLAAPARMLRLLQGDVGSGKTLVALLAMLSAIEAGGQAALMAPTEILARQHAATLERLLAPVGLAPALLTGRERGAPRRRLLTGLANGEARLAIGTHALFQDDVAFADLALAVVDEQHRFGVHQRLGLAAKGEADLLVMTATPIPRTLVLSLYGDMAVSELRRQAARPPADRDARDAARPDRGDRGGGRGGAGAGRAAVLGLPPGRRRRGRRSGRRRAAPCHAARPLRRSGRPGARPDGRARQGCGDGRASRAATSACWWPPR